jgi:hypothetical protein
MSRLKWAAEDRSQFFSAIEDLTRANDLLESLLRIKSLEDDTFAVRGSNPDEDTQSSIKTIRSSLEKLHRDLLEINPNGRDIDFSLKLALDQSDKETYADYVDSTFESDSEVFSLQAHLKTRHRINDRSVYLLAETVKGAPQAHTPPVDVITSFGEIDPDSDPAFQRLGDNGPHLSIFQDKSAEWKRTQTLADALRDQKFQDICFQKHYIQLGLFMAFSYAALSFTFKGKPNFPLTGNYVYYDQVASDSDIEDTSIDPGLVTDNNDEETSDDASADATPIEEAFQDLQSPYINYSFGSRATNLSTKTLGKRPGFTAPTNNPVVSLGLLLYQIGSWQPMLARDIAQMRRDALDRSHDLIRLSGVEFADITRTCLNWTQKGSNGKRLGMDSDEMLLKIYARLEEYNKGLHELM